MDPNVNEKVVFAGAAVVLPKPVEPNTLPFVAGVGPLAAAAAAKGFVAGAALPFIPNGFDAGVVLPFMGAAKLKVGGFDSV